MIPVDEVRAELRAFADHLVPGGPVPAKVAISRVVLEELLVDYDRAQKQLADLLGYVADAKAEAQQLGSYTGEPLAQFLRALRAAMTPAAIADLTRQALESSLQVDKLTARLRPMLMSAFEFGRHSHESCDDAVNEVIRRESP